MSRFTDAELYLRGSDTLLASWEAYACGAPGAAVKRFPGVAAALFPDGPERAVYNNALLQRDLGPDGRSDALDAMETAYARPASPASRPGCTRATGRCAVSSNGAVTPLIPRHEPWGWPSMTSAFPARRSRWGRRAGGST